MTMNKLGHSFCQRRKSSKRPRDLHIRKVSFSGCSLDSGYSDMSAETAAAWASLPIHSATSSASSTSQHSYGTSPSTAPPRLQDRAFIRAAPKPCFPSAFFDDEDDLESLDEDDYSVNEDDVVFSSEDEEEIYDVRFTAPPRSASSSTTTTTKTDARHVQEHEGYFFIMANKPAPMPGSRWSESTISSLGEDDDTVHDNDEEAEEDEEGPATLTPSLGTATWPTNFSYKRALSAPECTRPHLLPMDSVEEYIKRGGWKRRGIVFHSEDLRASDTGVYSL